MTQNAILYDSSVCSACKGCQVQCKQWNNMPSSLAKNSYEYTGTYQSMADLNGDTRLMIEFREEDTPKGIEWAFSRRACFHCGEPTCMEVCPVGAITKLEDGTVKLDDKKCIGCRYCTTACPFDVPKFRPQFNVSDKCTLCDDRAAQGLEPACVKTCPASALFYGPRDEMVAEGEARVEALKAAGFDKAELYGKTEMGGMHVLHVAKYGYEKHGYLRDPKRRVATSIMEAGKPLALLGTAAVVVGLTASYLTGIGYKREETTLDSKDEKKGEM